MLGSEGCCIAFLHGEAQQRDIAYLATAHKPPESHTTSLLHVKGLCAGDKPHIRLQNSSHL